jgi:hypothetical protein
VELTWTVTNGVCTTSSDQVILNNFQNPSVTNPTPVFCEDTEGSNNATVDLTAIENSINSDVNSTFTWFTNSDYSTGEISSGLTTYSVANGNILYVEVENSITSCINQTPVSFTVNSLPSATDLSKSLNETTANSGVAENIDLNQYNTEINANANDAGYSVTWYTETSPGSGVKDTEVNIVDIEDGERFIAVVKNPNNCENESIIDFTINTIPDIQDPEPVYCEDNYASGNALADLNEIESSYGLSGVIYTWYEDSGLSQPLSNQEEQTVTSSSFFYLKVEDDGNSSIFNSTIVTFTVNSKPEALDLSYDFCEETLGSLQKTLDLTSFHPDINTASSGTYSYEWFTTSDLNPSNEIPTGDLSSYTVSDGVSLYVKVTNDDTSCDNNSEISFSILPQPQVDIDIATTEICETDVFEVSNITGNITIQDQSSFQWTVVEGTESISNPTTLTGSYAPSATDIANGSIKLRLTAFGQSDCASVFDEITVNITRAPISNAGNDLTICEGDVIDFSTLPTQPNTSNESSIEWFTAGPTSGSPGAFGNTSTLLTTYTPSQDEIDEGSVELTLRANGQGSCDFVESSITVTINPEPTVSTIADFTICETETINISGDFGGSVNAAEWQIVSGNGNITAESTSGNTVSAVYQADPSDIGGNVILKLISTNQDAPCGIVEDQLTITIKEAPIATAPADFEICENENINLSGTIGGSAVNGQWIISTGSGTMGGSTVAGNTVTAIYTPSPADFGNTVTLQLVAFDPEGETYCANNSDQVSVMIRTLPVVNAGSDEEICEYETFNFSNASTQASVSNFNSIEWSTAGDGSFSNTTTLLPLYTPGPNDIANGSVTLTLTAEAVNGATCNDVDNSMTLTIKPQPTIAAIADKSLCQNETEAEIVLSADLAGGTFSWDITNNSQLGLNASGTGNIPSFTAEDNLTGSPITSVVTVEYELDGCVSDIMTFDIVTKPTPDIEQVQNITVCPGDLVEVDFEANTSGETFNWSNDATDIGIGSSVSSTGNISFTADANNSGSPITSTFTYSATLAGCQSDIKNFTVTVLPTPVFDPIPNIEVCSFDNISTSFNTNVSGVTYAWTNDNTNTGIPANGSGNLNFSADENLTGSDEISNITVTATRNGCPSVQESFQVVVKPKPIIVAQSDIIICPGDEISSISFSDNSAGNSTITWTATNVSNIGLPNSSGTSSIPAFTAATNNGTGVVSSTVTVTSTWDGCPSDQMTFRIILKPTPIMNPIADQAYCAGDEISTNFSNSLGAGTVYSWTNDNTDIGLAASGNNNFNFTLPENTTGAPIVANITVTPENNNCIGPSETFTITLNPTPVISNLADIAVCSEEVISIPVNTDLTNVNYSVSSTDNSLFTSTPTFNNGNIEFTMAINTSGADFTSIITITAEKDNCESQEDFEVTLKNRPVISSENDEAPLCAGDLVNPRTFTHTVGSGVFSWEITEPLLIGDGTATSGTGNFPGFNLGENNTGSTIEGYVKYLSTSNGCESIEDSFKITLKPTPVIQNTDIEICAGDFVNIEFLSNVNGNQTFNWTIDNLTIGINNSNGSTDQFITPAGFTAINNSTVDRVANITVFSTLNGCQGALKTFRVTVKPIPTITNDNFELQTCSNENFTFTPTSTITDAEFNWNLISANENVISGLEQSGTGPISLDLVNTSGVYQEIIYEITPLNGICSGEPEDLIISLAPEIAFDQIEDEYVVCSGQAFTLPLTVKNNLSGISYSWTVSANDAGANDSVATAVGGTLTNSIPGEKDTVIYTITPILNGGDCAGQTEQVRVIINPNVIVDINPVDDICEGQNISLQATISNGISTGSWSGGNGQFTQLTSLQTVYVPDESEFGEEVTLRFTANDPDQSGPCTSAFDEVTFAIDLLPTVSILGNPFPGNLYCVRNERIELNGSPAGGIFSGRGIVEENGKYFFDPEIATVGGPRTITYEYTNENNCTNFAEAIVRVTEGPESNFTSPADEVDGYFCANASIRLSPIRAGGTFSGPGIEVRQGISYFEALSPEVIESDVDTFAIRYTIFDDETSCEAFTTKIFRRIPQPEINVADQNICGAGNENLVQIDINTFYDTDKDGISLTSFRIEYNNGESENVNDNGQAILEYDTPGEKSITIIGRTDLGCEFEMSKEIFVGNIQSVDFSVSNLKTSTIGEPGTQFTNESILDVINGDPSINSIESFQWDFGVEGIETDVDTVENPTFNYTEADSYIVTLIIESSLNCFDTIKKEINIVPAISTYPYIETFDNSTGGWYTASNSEIASSWIYGFPNGAFVGQNDNPNPGRIWKTAAYPDSVPSGYRENENSFLVGPTFDLTGLEKPMIAFDMWLDVEDERFEGAILEFSTNGEDWTIFGDENDELNWYNVTNNSPIGGQASNLGNLAWYFTGEERQWTRVAHVIDNNLINDLSNVIFRINFRGDRFSGNPDGMAIDNFYVGERQKLVLLENFTNLNSPDYLNKKEEVQALLNSEIGQDILSLNYHISSPEPDSINLRNPIEVDSRATIYSIDESSQLIIDGSKFTEAITNSNGILSEDFVSTITRQALLEPVELIDLAVDGSADQHTIRFSISQKSTEIANDNVIAYFVIVEKSAGEGNNMTNIVRKILPNINGLDLKTLESGSSLTYEWEVNSIYTNEDLAIATIIQDQLSNEVLEVNLTDINDFKTPKNVLSIKEASSLRMEIYPNPSRGIVNIAFSQTLAQDLELMVFDVRGTMIKHKTVKAGANTEQFDLNEVASGVYHIISKDHEGNLSRMKIVILD